MPAAFILHCQHHDGMTTVVERVEAIPVAVSLEDPFGYAQGWVSERTATLVRVEASDGTVGWGECWGPHAGTCETIREFLAPRLIGTPPDRVERIHERLREDARAAYQSVVPLPALSGVDIALWDLKGKRVGASIATLLGGARREAVRPYATGHYFRHDATIEEQYESITREARDNLERMEAVKLKIGFGMLGHDAATDIELVERVVEADPDATIMVDANYAYDIPTARRVGHALESFDVAWFEEPVHPEQLAGYEHLRSVLDIPVAGGECHTPWEFRQLFDRGGLDVAQPDLCNVGGLTAAKRIADRARAEGLAVYPHVWGTPVALGAALQLLATLPGDPWLEFDTSPNPLRSELTTSPLVASDGTVSVPGGPGIGITIDEDAVARYRVD